MSAEIIDGFSIAQQVRKQAADEAAKLTKKGITPCLAVVLVGENPASVSYVTAKEKALEEAGMKGKDIRLSQLGQEVKRGRYTGLFFRIFIRGIRDI